MFFKKKAACDLLSHAVDVLMKHNTEEAKRHVFDVFRRYVEDGKWLFSIGEVNETGTKVYTVQERGKQYIPVYTEGKLVEKGRGTVLQTDVNKYLETLYATTDISGLVLNPGSQNLYLEKNYIPAILIHDKFPKENNAGSPQKDWGRGIPEYKNSDLMTKGQLLNFAMRIVHEYDLQDSEFAPISFCDNSNAQVNFIIKKGNDIFFVYVYPYALPNEPVFKDDTKRTLLDLCKKFNAKCLFAPVGFCSCDEERASAGLFLKGDGLNANYTGMELVEE